MPRFTVYAAWYQFWLSDERAPPGSLDWTEEAVHGTRVAMAPGVLAVSTTRYGFVPVEVIVETVPSPVQGEDWDHVVEASIAVPSGVLVLVGPATARQDAERVLVRPGVYRARVCLRGLSDPFARQPQDGDDEVVVVLWPAPHAPVHILKQYEAQPSGPT